MSETVLITGANRGLGYALAVAFSEAGYRLILHCRRQEELRRIAELFPESVVVGGELRDHVTMHWFDNQLKEKQVDILVNNAGVYLGKQFSDTSWADMWQVVETNLIAPMILTKILWPKLKVVINVSSLAGVSPGSGESIYAASKAGLSGFSRGLQFDGTKDGVRVIDVLLGSMDTDMTKGRGDPGKMMDPHEVARMIVCLCEDDATMRVTSIEMKRRIY